ncbi:hypothetical protein EPUS_00032 [Endocarpon pusillum Z07020]|uniref:Uncharacterized protein n=1 Tax=Endocarpon pusillum (strain Z07020 / HMAS-L-300199) TaxID=1263415 RepID=U1HWT6_ENDPU|nr:uncharacterized protein EPUS_00032 [Endocarpon pusillum Z07020]ERF75240.1 hypothetical protein EPUS_00032 [Endocarpon pusillum Z07020]
MGLPSLTAASLMDWAAIDLILTSLFAAIITVNLLLLRRRVHRLERRKIFDLEKGRHDVELLNKFRDLQTTESKNGPLDEKAFQCFMELAGGKIPSLDSKCEDQETAFRYEQLLQAAVKFFHPERSEASVNEKQELGAVVATPEFTAAVLDEPQSNNAGHVTELDNWCRHYNSPSEPLFTVMEQDGQLSQINSWSLPKYSGCSKKMAGDNLSPIDFSKTSSKVIMDEQEFSGIPNLNRMTSEEDSSQPSSKKLFNAPVVPACWSEHQQSLYDASTIDPALTSGAGYELTVKGPSTIPSPPLRSSSFATPVWPGPNEPSNKSLPLSYLPDRSLPGSDSNADKYNSAEEILEAALPEDGIENPLLRLPPQDDEGSRAPQSLLQTRPKATKHYTPLDAKLTYEVSSAPYLFFSPKRLRSTTEHNRAQQSTTEQHHTPSNTLEPYPQAATKSTNSTTKYCFTFIFPIHITPTPPPPTTELCQTHNTLCSKAWNPQTMPVIRTKRHPRAWNRVED